MFTRHGVSTVVHTSLHTQNATGHTSHACCVSQGSKRRAMPTGVHLFQACAASIDVCTCPCMCTVMSASQCNFSKFTAYQARHVVRANSPYACLHHVGTHQVQILDVSAARRPVTLLPATACTRMLSGATQLVWRVRVSSCCPCAPSGSHQEQASLATGASAGRSSSRAAESNRLCGLQHWAGVETLCLSGHTHLMTTCITLSCLKYKHWII
jgi:hypothetical protein